MTTCHRFFHYCLAIGASLMIVGCQQPSLQAALESYTTDAVAKRNLVGLGISIRLADGRVLQAAAGSTAPVSPSAYSVQETRQIIGSVTKLYVATLAMQLVEEGTLSLDDTIDRWMDVDVPAGDRITVRMLLDHTSGLGDCLADMTSEERLRAWTPEELIARAVAHGPMAAPGDTYARYSNTNFVILARIVELQTGESWTERIASHITKPLGLSATASATTPEGLAGLTAGWVNVNGQWVSSLPLADPSTGWGMGALATTNAEMMSFLRAFFDGALFAQRATLDQMLDFAHEVDPATLHGQPPTRIGLAVHRFDIGDVSLIGHLGHTIGYDNAALRDTKTGALITVTTNTDAPGASALIAYDVAQYLRTHGQGAN